jgi:hypothetical protein
MAIDLTNLFNPGTLADIAGEDERKKKAQLTGTLELGGQSGTFNGSFDPSALQQAFAGLQPINVPGQTPSVTPITMPGQQPPPEQPTLLPAPRPAPPVGTSPISGEYGNPSGGQPIPRQPGNQPYQPPPPPSDFGHYPIDPITGLPPGIVVDDHRYKGDDYLYRGPIQDQPYQPPPPNNSLQISDLGGGWGRGADGKTYERNYASGGWDYSPTNNADIGISTGIDMPMSRYGPPDQMAEWQRQADEYARQQTPVAMPSIAPEYTYNVDPGFSMPDMYTPGYQAPNLGTTQDLFNPEPGQPRPDAGWNDGSNRLRAPQMQDMYNSYVRPVRGPVDPNAPVPTLY